MSLTNVYFEAKLQLIYVIDYKFSSMHNYNGTKHFTIQSVYHLAGLRRH